MAQVGTLGDVVFEVSNDVIRTFKDYKRKTSARMTTHEIIGQKPVIEFLGANIEALSFTIQLSAFKGVNPKEETDKLREIVSKGQTVNLIIAGAPITNNQWIIETVNENAIAYDEKGNIIRSDIDISMQEYVLREDEKQNANN